MILITDRRTSNRVDDSFPVTFLIPRFFSGSPRGMAKNYDNAGICIQCTEVIPLGAEVILKLAMPQSISGFFKGLGLKIPATVTSVREIDTLSGPAYDIILRWDTPLEEITKKAVSRYQRKIGLLIGVILTSMIVLKWWTLDYFWYSPFLYIYSFALTSFLISRFFISAAHRPPKKTDYLPPISVVISVRNEKEFIGRTIEMCYAADYPDSLREVIVVDDGSTDGTQQVIMDMTQRFPDLKVHLIPPSGKREAMAKGVLSASGELIVFLDSDTFIYPNALREIVCGFEDPTLGASAGYTGVENADVNALTGMQEVRYYVSNRLMKASESFYSCVTCCPGCLSAYRRSYLLEILIPWLNQKFLGRPATFGDDRSLTNFILRKYRVIYNDKAMATTLVPENWMHYMRQQVRWKKSWLRETLIASGFMLSKHPAAALSFYASSLFSLASPALLYRILFVEFYKQEPALLYYMLGLLMVALLQAIYFLYKRYSSNWVFGMLWMASSLLIMGPQTYYALLTIRKNHWGTR